MNLKKTTLRIIVMVTLASSISSCKSQASKDAAAKAKIAALVPGISVEVKDGIATVNGIMPSEQAKTAAATAIKSVENINSLVINAAVVGPQVQVFNNPDQPLIDAVAPLLKEFPGITASIKDSVITLGGEIQKTGWTKLKPLIDALHPKQVLQYSLIINQ